MRYKIKRIKSQEKKWERIILVALIIIYFLCFALSEAYENHVFSEWIFEIHKKLSK